MTAIKFAMNFNEFAQWYIGEQCTDERIVDYFEQDLLLDARPFIGKEVVFTEKKLPYAPHLFEYTIEGTDFAVDAISAIDTVEQLKLI
jgi:Na+/phosphate symporter